MKLLDALEIVKKRPPNNGRCFRAFLSCGFSPLHLQTFLDANYRIACGEECKSEVLSGLYGDFWGNLDRLKAATVDAGLIVVEWSDFDPRLGLRSLGSWSPAVLPEIVGSVKKRSAVLVDAIEEIAKKASVAISFPTLPLPPISFVPSWQSSAFETELRAALSTAAVRTTQIPNVKLLDQGRLDCLSAPNHRLDAKSEILSGFPYKLAHASVVAELLVRMTVPSTPKKGLITDLDDTLWRGVVGEVGSNGIFWDMEHNGQLHGLYQRLLCALSDAGVLIAAASKNERQSVNDAFARTDLVVAKEAIFPMEVHWGPKSVSVGRILRTWHIAPDAVVFVDDSPLELAEVKAAYPGIECILFPKDDPQQTVELLYHIRDLFGKTALSEEDRIRQKSIRQAQEIAADLEAHNGSLNEFLAQAEAEISVNFSKVPRDPRAFELVNKTNQFNLNGRRYTDAAWQAFTERPDSVLLVAAYQDKYGPLGKIAVAGGQLQGKTLRLQFWVMSCRAFSRLIEHRCIAELFKHYPVDDILFEFQATPKNGPLREFLTLFIGAAPAPGCRLSRERFLAMEPENIHRVVEISNG